MFANANTRRLIKKAKALAQAKCLAAGNPLGPVYGPPRPPHLLPKPSVQPILNTLGFSRNLAKAISLALRYDSPQVFRALSSFDGITDLVGYEEFLSLVSDYVMMEVSPEELETGLFELFVYLITKGLTSLFIFILDALALVRKVVSSVISRVSTWFSSAWISVLSLVQTCKGFFDRPDFHAARKTIAPLSKAYAVGRLAVTNPAAFLLFSVVPTITPFPVTSTLSLAAEVYQHNMTNFLVPGPLLPQFTWSLFPQSAPALSVEGEMDYLPATLDLHLTICPPTWTASSPIRRVTSRIINLPRFFSLPAYLSQTWNLASATWLSSQARLDALPETHLANGLRSMFSVLSLGKLSASLTLPVLAFQALFQTMALFGLGMWNLDLLLSTLVAPVRSLFALVAWHVLGAAVINLGLLVANSVEMGTAGLLLFPVGFLFAIAYELC